MTSGQDAIKRAVDVVSALALLGVASPLMIGAALLIRAESRGPVFFRQERLGRGGTVFRIWKFRTMVQDAGVLIDAKGKVVNEARDRRHTRVGRILRSWSVDELPQLFNVVRGEMSLVGPRPDLPGALALYTPAQRRKLEVRPGITGLAQIRGRNELDPADKWNLDAEYAAHQSLTMDLRILVETARQVLMRKSVYQSSAGTGPQ